MAREKTQEEKDALIVRQALLMLVDVIERRYDIVSFSTAEARKFYKMHGPKAGKSINIDHGEIDN